MCSLINVVVLLLFFFFLTARLLSSPELMHSFVCLLLLSYTSASFRPLAILTEIIVVDRQRIAFLLDSNVPLWS